MISKDQKFEIQFADESRGDDNLPFLCAIAMGMHAVDVFSRVNSPLPYFEGEGKNYIPWIPGWNVRKIPSQSGYSMRYTPDSKTQFNYAETQKRLTIKGKEKDFSDGQAMAYLCFWLTEAQRQKESIVTSHAVALSHGGKGILVFGERGDGKTSVALALARTYGYKLIANDLAMVGLDTQKEQVLLRDGTKIFGLRLSAIRGRFPELLYLFPNQTTRSWTTKAFVYPNEIGIDIEPFPQPLQCAVMVYVDSTKTDRLSVSKMNDLWTKNYLYENFSRYLRATAILPFGAQSGDFLDYLPSLDNHELHKNRVRLIRHLIEKTEIWNVSSGRLEEIRDWIHEKTEKY